MFTVSQFPLLISFVGCCLGPMNAVLLGMLLINTHDGTVMLLTFSQKQFKANPLIPKTNGAGKRELTIVQSHLSEKRIVSLVGKETLEITCSRNLRAAIEELNRFQKTE